jgi:hypothetical protein
MAYIKLEKPYLGQPQKQSRLLLLQKFETHHGHDQRPFVLEIRTTNAVPDLPAVFFMGSPVALYSKRLSTFPTHERLDSMLSLVMCLEGSEIFEWPCSRVINVVLATLCTAIAWQL